MEAWGNLLPSFPIGMISDPAIGTQTVEQTYLGIKLPSQYEGLLVDTGAFENMMGSEWLQNDMSNFETQVGEEMEVRYNALVNSTGITGVGAKVIPVNHAVTIPIAIPGAGQSNFRGPVLPESKVPALLGTKSMQKKNVILDLRDGHLKMWTAINIDDLEIRPRTGAIGVNCLQLEQATSGHLLLPCTAYEKIVPKPSEGPKAYPAQEQ